MNYTCRIGKLDPNGSGPGLGIGRIMRAFNPGLAPKISSKDCPNWIINPSKPGKNWYYLTLQIWVGATYLNWRPPPMAAFQGLEPNFLLPYTLSLALEEFGTDQRRTESMKDNKCSPCSTLFGTSECAESAKDWDRLRLQLSSWEVEKISIL